MVLSYYLFVLVFLSLLLLISHSLAPTYGAEPNVVDGQIPVHADSCEVGHRELVEEMRVGVLLIHLHSFNHLTIHSIIHLFIHSCWRLWCWTRGTCGGNAGRGPPHSPTFIHSFNNTFNYSFIHSFMLTVVMLDTGNLGNAGSGRSSSFTCIHSFI